MLKLAKKRASIYQSLEAIDICFSMLGLDFQLDFWPSRDEQIDSESMMVDNWRAYVDFSFSLKRSNERTKSGQSLQIQVWSSKIKHRFFQLTLARATLTRLSRQLSTMFLDPSEDNPVTFGPITSR